MTSFAHKRSTSQGFLQLMPQREPADPQRMMAELDELARQARGEALDAAALAWQAAVLEEQGAKTAPRYLRQRSTIAHRAAVAKLHALALKARALVQWAAVDWLPTTDVVGSGLVAEELYQLSSVYGMPVDRLRGDRDEAGK